MKKILLRIISILGLLCTFFIIFQFSAQNGEQSGSLSHRITTGFVNNVIYMRDLNAEEKEKLIIKIEPIVRKLAHLSIYTIVGICMMTFMSTFYMKSQLKIGTSFLLGIIYAMSDEWHQSFVPRKRSILERCRNRYDGCVIGNNDCFMGNLYFRKKKSKKSIV